MTVEASLVFPMILGVLLLLIYLLFFLHGRVVLSANAYGSAIRLSSLNKYELEYSLKEYNSFSYSKELLLGHWTGTSSVTAKADIVISKISATSPLAVPFLNTAENLKVSVNGMANKSDAVDIIRKIRLAIKLYEKVKENTNNK